MREVNCFECIATYFRIGACGEIPWEIFVQFVLQGAKPKVRVLERVAIVRVKLSAYAINAMDNSYQLKR